jgi:hypothetical protein
MIQIYAEQGLVRMLTRIANAAGAGLYWQLFSSNTTPTRDSVFADFAFWNTSYGRIQVAVASFTLTQVAAHVGSIQAPNIVFTNTSGGNLNVYGYCIVDPTSSELIAAARQDSAPTVVANNGTFTVTPILGDADDSTL